MLPFVSPAFALITGILLALLKITNSNYSKYSSKILQYAIVLLGFGMNLTEVYSLSKTGFLETFVSVSLVVIVGLALGKLLRIEKHIATLISVGTAICGGSAIAAVSPILRSKDSENTMALIVVFSLNAIALIIFPYIGHYFNLSQEVFGNWAAIAIHDTSSVVGAAMAYGDESLKIATTIKLIRALWIIPLSIFISIFFVKTSIKKIRIPWFILFFVLAIIFSNYFKSLDITYMHLNWLGKKALVIALFLIGTNIDIQKIKESGKKAFLMGLILWVLISSISLIILK
jgi:uncharacterized integral membrane protein (TIGR00698 family)